VGRSECGLVFTASFIHSFELEGVGGLLDFDHFVLLGLGLGFCSPGRLEGFGERWD
jgi:hypothetical protein